MTGWVLHGIFWFCLGWVLKGVNADYYDYKSGRDRWNSQNRRASDILRELNIK